MALHVIVQGNKDLEFRYKTKIMRSIYTNHLTDNNLILSEAPIKHQGGVAIFFCDYSHFQIAVNQSSAPMSSSSSWLQGGNGGFLSGDMSFQEVQMILSTYPRRSTTAQKAWN